LEGVGVGLTSPATLVVPAGYLKHPVSQRIPWVEDGFFSDPVRKSLTQNQKSILASWLQNLHTELLRNPVNRTLAGEVAGELDKFLRDLAVPTLGVFQPSKRPLPFGEPLAPAPLTALIPAEAVEQESNVRVCVSQGLTPAKQLYLIDTIQLPKIMGKEVREINVIGSSSLLNFDPLLHQRSDALFLAPGDLFTDRLFYTKSKGLLPGTWLDRKLNLDNLSIFLPLNPILRDYFSSEDLEKRVQLSAVNTPEGPGIRVTLGLKLSGFEGNPVDYQVYKDFPLRAENEINQAFPTLALWPNVPPGKWREYFVLVENSEGFGDLAFGIEQPTDNATVEIRKSGQESYQYWKCDRFPEILSAIDKNGRFLGLLPLNTPKVQPSSTGNWTVGVDFGTSFTNIYVRKGSTQPQRFNLQSNLLKITKGLEDIQAVTYREFFIADTFLPEGDNPPLSTILTSRGWQETEGQIPSLISQARIYFTRLDQFDFDKDYIKTNIKWQQVQYQRPFLSQLLRLVAAQAAQEDVHTIEWAISYPSAFSQSEINRYEITWQNIFQDLSKISGQIHKQSDTQGLRTESIAFAQFFGDVLNKDLVHTTCVDVGGGTSDISVWEENTLVHQTSVPYAGRDLFHRILQPNLAFVGDIFGLSSQNANSVRQQLASKNNFNAALDTYLRGNTDNILTDGYVIHADKPRNREFRTLVAFALGGLYHYLGLVQKYLKESGLLIQGQNVTSILIGGNGSRFLHWLTTSGRYTQNSEVNVLLQDILAQASGLQPNPNFMTLSPQPKEEACGGLVVLPDGEKLKGFAQKQKDYPFLGEHCTINGQPFVAWDRLNLSDMGETIEDFRITSFTELEQYIKNFNQIITDRSIEEINPLRNFGKGGLLTLTEDLSTLLQTSVTQASLRKKGPVTEFEPEPPFLLTLRCFVGVLADQWSKSAG
jgi:hypothetical protein